MGGGKGGTTTQSVKIPPEVLARYNAVNARAEKVAERPFQQYTGQFVAPLTGTQQAGIANISQAAGMAQPYYDAAAGLTSAGSRGVGPLTRQQIQYYQDPYTESVVQPTMAALRQQQGQERAVQQAQAIRSGGFGGDRAGLERANLARQQALGMAQAISPLYSQGYQIGLQTASNQQGVEAQNLQRQLAAGQQFGGLGSGAQAAALQGAQAQLGAGTLEQQTQQADLTARYQQFLQERGYDFQVAQFLANIAMGTGALSGSTTTTTQPTSYFSDERLKENVKPIGETFDGQTIYKYNYKGEPHTQIGLIAQEVEHHKPEAVGEASGFKTVDYDRATEEAGGLGKALASMGGAVREPGAYARGGYAPGGLVDPNDIQALLASQKAGFGPFGSGGPYGQNSDAPPFAGAGGVVPTSRLPTPKLVTAGGPPQRLRTGMEDMMEGLEKAKRIGAAGKEAGDFVFGVEPKKDPNTGKPIEGTGSPSLPERLERFKSFFDRPGNAYGGGIRPHLAAGGAGSINPYDPKQDQMDYFPEEVLEEGDPDKLELPKPGQPPGGGGGGLGQALGTAASAIGAASTIGSGIAKAAPYLMALIPSDRRLKHDVEPVGKTYDGQNIYRYHMGDGAMRMGLMAQEVAEHKPDAVARGPEGYLMLDYDKATDDREPHRGGVMPREGLQTGGPPSEEPFDIVEEYWPRVEKQESRGQQFDPATGRPLTSRAGAIGVAQVMPKTAPEAAKLAGLPFDERRYQEDEGYNRALGQAYLREQQRRFKDPVTALAAYNAGPTRVRRALAEAENSGGSFLSYLPEETRKYVATIAGVSVPPVAQARGRAGDLPSPNAAPVSSGGIDPATLSGVVARAREAAPGAPAAAGAPPAAGSEAAPKPAGGVKPLSDMFGGPPIRFGTKTAQNPKGEQFGSMGEFFTSRQFLQPALIGLATMASSPSRYLGSAVLQGLGGGATAYSDLEKQMADVAGTQAKTQETTARTGLTESQTLLTKAQAAGASLKEQSDGRLLILVRNKATGKVDFVNFYGEYDKRPQDFELIIEGQPGAGGLGAGKAAATGAAGSGAAGSGAPTRDTKDTIAYKGIKPIDVERRELPPPAGAEAAPGVKPSGATATTEPPAAPEGGVMPRSSANLFEMTPRILARAEAEAAERPSMGNLDTLPPTVTDAAARATVSTELMPTLIQIGILGSTPREGFLKQALFQPVALEVARSINDLASRLPGINQVFPGGNIFDRTDIGDALAWKKKIAELRAKAADERNQTAVASLDKMEEMFPMMSQEPEGFAKNLAEILIGEQKNIQRSRFVQNYATMIREKSGDRRQPNRLMAGLDEAFETEYGGIFADQQKALERMLRADKPEFWVEAKRRPGQTEKEYVRDANGRPMSWFTYLQTYGDRLPPETIRDVEKRFNAPGIMEYFRTGRGVQ